MAGVTDKQFKQFIHKKQFLKITRLFENDDTDQIRGFLLGMSEHLLLIQREDEFRLNGICIIRKTDVHSIVSGKFEEWMKDVLKQEGVLEKDYGFQQDIDLSNWLSVFTSLDTLDFHAMVECENDEDPSFFIGPISEILDESVGIRYYTPNAVLDVDATFIEFDDITTVTFADRYTQVYRKYLRTDS